MATNHTTIKKAERMKVLCLLGGQNLSASTGYEKPNPEAWYIALRNLDPDTRVIMVGDNVNADARGAEQIGLPSILVRKQRICRKFFPHPIHECNDL